MGMWYVVGQVPENIIAEYYWVLAEHVLDDEPIGAKQKITALKSLILAGNQKAATSLFRDLLVDSDGILVDDCFSQAVANLA